MAEKQLFVASDVRKKTAIRRTKQSLVPPSAHSDSLKHSGIWSANLLDAMTLQPQHLVGNRPRPELYRWKRNATVGRHVISDWASVLLDDERVGDRARELGFVPGMLFLDEDRHDKPDRNSAFPFQNAQTFRRDISIAWTRAGDVGPIVVFLHGVPTSRKQWEPVQMLLAPFCRTLSLDFLGLGESSKPLNYPEEAYDWHFDVVWIEHTVRALFGTERFVFVADDWGAGPALKYAERYGQWRLLGLALLDPISLDGYPVAEIQAIGRDIYGAYKNALNSAHRKHAGAHPVSEHVSAVMSAAFAQATAGFDQTLVQIYKTMVSTPNRVYDQYSLRTLKEAYVDTNYARLKNPIDQNSTDASSTTLLLNQHAIAVLAIRASRLAPAQMLPYDDVRNERGIDYHRIDVPCMVLWGEDDTMMPVQQTWRYEFLLQNSPLVHTHEIPRAGHYAATDQPDAIAEELLKFVRQLVGTGTSPRSGGLWRTLAPKRQHGPGLAQAFVGYRGIWKGDEEQLLRRMNNYYRI